MRANVVIDGSTTVMPVVASDLSADKEVVVVTVAMIDLGLLSKVADAGKVLAGVRVGAIIEGGYRVGNGVDVSGLAVVVTALEVALPSRDPFVCCWAPMLSCCLTTVLDCGLTLHACKPSCHV